VAGNACDRFDQQHEVGWNLPIAAHPLAHRAFTSTDSLCDVALALSRGFKKLLQVWHEQPLAKLKLTHKREL
jgi:hypothetical protein